MKFLLLIALIFSTQALRADDQCQKDIMTLHGELEKLQGDVKAKNAETTEAVLRMLLKTMPDLEKVCHLEGECLKDVQMVDEWATKMLNATEAGNWETVDQDYEALLKMYEQAHSDCHSPGPTPDSCRKDLFNIEVDFRKLNASVRAHQANATEAELKYLSSEVAELEKACNLTGMCKDDFDHVSYLAQVMLYQTEHGNWEGTERGYMFMTETFERTRRDCGQHPQPPHPSECREAEERMEEVLQDLDMHVHDRWQEGVEKFSQYLEHEVYNIERACSVMEKCKADWNRVGEYSKFMNAEAEKGDWDEVDMAWGATVELIRNEIYDDCDHH